MAPTPSDRTPTTRRGVLTTVGLAVSSGCLGYDVVRSDRLDDTNDRITALIGRRIVDQYEDGQRLRNVASEHWHRGSESLERRFYRRASRAFVRASSYFDSAARQFRAAREASNDAALVEARATCESARRYCASMALAAEAYATAADLNAAGTPDSGDRYLDRGWEHYRTAIRHDIPPTSELRETLPD